MQNRHRETLLRRLDELFVKRFTFITWSELYYWFDIERVAKRPYRVIDELWKDLQESRKIPGDQYSDLKFMDNGNGLVLLYDDEDYKLQTLSAFV